MTYLGIAVRAASGQSHREFDLLGVATLAAVLAEINNVGGNLSID